MLFNSPPHGHGVVDGVLDVAVRGEVGGDSRDGLEAEEIGAAGGGGGEGGSGQKAGLL